MTRRRSAGKVSASHQGLESSNSNNQIGTSAIETDIQHVAEVATCSSFRGLFILLCGVPGCGKDVIGRGFSEMFSSGIAVSQDECGGDASRLSATIERLLSARHSPIILMRNNTDAADRAPYIHAARRHSYWIAAVWPSELSDGDLDRKAALYLAAISGCYGRLIENGTSGHETLTISGDMMLPARVCLSFLKSFRTPSAPGEVDKVFPMPFLQDRLDIKDATGWQFGDDFVSVVAAQMRQKKEVPVAVASCLGGTLGDAQTRLLPFVGLRRPVEELVSELQKWVMELISNLDNSTNLKTFQSPLPVPAPSRDETRRLQRAVKIRAAVEHLVSPANISGCRPNGSTVTNCTWIRIDESDEVRPAWPVSHFCGAPQLKRLGATAEELLQAVRASTDADAPLQEGEDGIRVEAIPETSIDLPGSTSFFISTLDPLPGVCLSKLGCPTLDQH